MFIAFGSFPPFLYILREGLLRLPKTFRSIFRLLRNTLFIVFACHALQHRANPTIEQAAPQLQPLWRGSELVRLESV
jgi:hypothetical protein